MTACRRPNLLVVGVTKGGTTSLFEYLVQHPEVAGSSVKETEFFSPLLYPGATTEPLAVYERYFRGARDERYVMEASANYWYGGPRLLAALEDALDHPRYVVSLRDPVDRFWSEFTYMQSKALLPHSMAASEFLDRCLEERSAGTDLTPAGRRFRTVSTGCYDEHLPAWLDATGDRTRVVFFEHLTEDPARVVSGIVGWLGIGTDVVPRFDFGARNPTRDHRNRRLQQVAYRAARPLEAALHRAPRLKRALVRGYEAVNAGDRRSAPVDPAVAGRLAEFFRPHSAALAADLTARGITELPGWLPSA